MLSTIMQYWWVLAMISGLGLATRNIMFKVGSGHMDAALGSLVLSISMASVSIGYFLWNRLSSGEPFFSGAMDAKGALYAMIAGVGVAGANIFLAHGYKAGGQASLVAILQNGFSISVTIVVGMLVLGEVIRPLQGAGIACALVGMVLIAKG
jgi:uncharacterized membrane protein